MAQAIAFSRESGYRSVMLKTVDALLGAARLYRAAGFRLVDEKAGRHWGVDVVEETFELRLRSA